MKRFTPLVNLDPGGDALLLEIAASLALFGGPGALLDAAVSGIEGRGHDVAAAIAPTARAALWLARSGQRQLVVEEARLPAVLAGIPVELSGWPAAVVGGLQRMGVRSLGDCMRLPRDGLARRLGRECLQEIDEALGRRPELRPACRHEGAPGARNWNWPVETRDSRLLLEALQLLLLRLHARFAATARRGAQVLWLRLRHHAAGDSLLRIGLLRPEHRRGRGCAHWQPSISPRCAWLRPWLPLVLEADVARLQPVDASRPARPEARPGRAAGRADGAVAAAPRHSQRCTGLRASPEHRPERAWRPVVDALEPNAMEPNAMKLEFTGAAACGLRPLWILAEPAVLARRGDAPLFHGSLVLEDGPERIEAGWWDGAPVSRDYFVAANPAGETLWIYRERRDPGAWYLHGLFA
jgi:protein ImuB